MRRPSPSATLAAARARLAEAGRAIAGAVASAGDRAHARWRGLSVYARRRIVAAAGVVVVVLVVALVAVPNLPCSFPGGDACPPTDDAEALVPADALAYLHATLDDGSEQYEALAATASRVPVLSGQLAQRGLALVPGPGGGAPDFERDVRPWFGGELAIAVLRVDEGTEAVVLLEVDDSEGASGYAASIATGTAEPSQHREIEVAIDARGLATAQLEDFLVVGSAAGVRTAIDAATGAGGAPTLADSEPAAELRDQLPPERVAEAWVSAEGAVKLIAESRGFAGTLAPLVAPGASEGVAASLSAAEDGELELAVRSGLDPERAGASPAFFAAFSAFEPELPERLAPETLAYVGIGRPQQTVAALLAQAAAQAPGIAAGYEDLVERLGEDGVDLERELLAAFDGEAAFALAPRPAGVGPALPFVEFLADEVDAERARRALAALQVPLAEAVDTDAGLQAPNFGEQEIGGVEARSLRISPTVELTYALFDGLAAIATDPAGIEQLAAGDGGLSESELYERATEGFEDEVSMLAFLDLSELVSLGEELGLAEDPVYATFAGEFRRLEALGLAITSGGELLSTDARLLLAAAESD